MALVRNIFPAQPTQEAPKSPSQMQGQTAQVGGTTGISTKPMSPSVIPPMTPKPPLQTATRGGPSSGKPHVPPVPPGGRTVGINDRGTFGDQTPSGPPPPGGGGVGFLPTNPITGKPFGVGGSPYDGMMAGSGTQPGAPGSLINTRVPVWNQGIAGPMDMGQNIPGMKSWIGANIDPQQRGQFAGLPVSEQMKYMNGGMPQQPQQGFSAWQVNQRANEYAQPLQPYMDTMDRQLQDRLRSTFGAGRGQVGGAVNRQAMDTLENDAMNRRQLAADFLNQATERARGDISNIWNTENQLGFGSWSKMADIAANRENLGNQLGFNQWSQLANIGANREQLQNQLGFNQWQNQFQDAAQARAADALRQWQSGESALDRSQQTNMFNAQQANQQAALNQQNRNALMTGLLGPVLGGWLQNQINPGAGEQQQLMNDWLRTQINQRSNTGGAPSFNLLSLFGGG